jgi:hypothetical protein
VKPSVSKNVEILTHGISHPRNIVRDNENSQITYDLLTQNPCAEKRIAVWDSDGKNAGVNMGKALLSGGTTHAITGPTRSAIQKF